jgi:hypothetical protein
VAKNYINLIYSVSESASMELGGVLGEACGKVACLKPIGDGKIEVSLQGKDKLLGSYVDDIGTFCSAMKTNSTAYGEGIAVHMSIDDMAEWRGSGKASRTQEGRRQER